MGWNELLRKINAHPYGIWKRERDENIGSFQLSAVPLVTQPGWWWVVAQYYPRYIAELLQAFAEPFHARLPISLVITCLGEELRLLPCSKKIRNKNKTSKKVPYPIGTRQLTPSWSSSSNQRASARHVPMAAHPLKLPHPFLIASAGNTGYSCGHSRVCLDRGKKKAVLSQRTFPFPPTHALSHCSFFGAACVG